VAGSRETVERFVAPPPLIPDLEAEIAAASAVVVEKAEANPRAD